MTRYILPSLPSTWRTLPLGQLAAIRYGKALRADLREDTGSVPVYGSGGIVGYHNEALHQTPSLVIGRKGSVGAVFLAEKPFWCIDTAFYLDEVNAGLDLGFLSRYLDAVNLSQLTIVVGVPGLNRDELASVPIPLPTLSEQRRVVDILVEAEKSTNARTAFENQVNEIGNEFSGSLFGNLMTNDRNWPTKSLGSVADIVRGSSPRPQGDRRWFGGTVPRLMVADLTRDGLWVQARTDSLTEEGAKRSRWMDVGSVVIAVSGVPGLSAILEDGCCIHDGFVGLRNLTNRIEPAFLAHTLNLLKARHDQQAVGAVFRNLTTDQVKAIKVPIPPRNDQTEFSQFLLATRELNKLASIAKDQQKELNQQITLAAFAGEVTAVWRERHYNELVQADEERWRHHICS